MKVEWRPKALEDRERIYDEIEQVNIQAAIDLDTEFSEKCRGLADFPYLYGPGRLKGTREMEIRKTHILVYCVREEQDRVEILRIQVARKKKTPRF